MATAKTNNKKAPSTFLGDHGYGPAQLRVVLARVDWSQSDAFARGQRALALFIATIAELLVASARAQRRSVGQLLNALVTGNDPGELPLLGLALQQLELPAARRKANAAAGAHIRGLPAKSRIALDAAARSLASHARLLREGSIPAARLTDLVDIDTDTLLPLLARQLRTGHEPATATLRLLKLAAQSHGQPEEHRSVLLRRARLLQKLPGDALAPLDYRAFRTLPAALRQVLLFTPALARSFLDAQAQAAARPPSPDFDPLYLDHALAELGHGRLAHVDVDTLFLGAQSLPAFRARIVDVLAQGSGNLVCSDDVRERLIAGAGLPELCLVACAAAASAGDVQRALSQLAALPKNGVLGVALYRFALIAWRDALPAEVPAAIMASPRFPRDMLAGSAQQLAAHLGGEAVHPAPAQLFRQFSAWLTCAGRGTSAEHSLRAATGMLDALFATQAGKLAADINGNDLYALLRAGETGARLARSLAHALRAQNAARWEHGFFTRLADLDPAAAHALAGNEPTGNETEILRLTAAELQSGTSKGDVPA